MTLFQKISLVLLRLTLGWVFFWAGITKVLDPSWSAGGYLTSASTFPGFYSWLASAPLLPLVNFVNAWGLMIVGALLILGLGVRVTALAGVVFMALYYLPALDFPYPNAHAFLVDEHIVYIAALLALVSFRAGEVWNVTHLFKRR